MDNLPIEFVMWYSGMDREKILKAYKKWMAERWIRYDETTEYHIDGDVVIFRKDYGEYGFMTFTHWQKLDGELPERIKEEIKKNLGQTRFPLPRL